ncbi:Hypp8415 [Branchiostoma lanceolatum]|uniref:Hypp8415 protein n=1 Tax=Branchiostoma lanceolatum TaxID=7740 RepID=A0A8J9Z801_BRALA|nr:Hypp8415 [Branchiostoma lanceolatum]
MGTTESKSEAKPGLMAEPGCACILCPLKKLSRKRKVHVLGEGGVRLVAPFKTPVSLESESVEAESSESESSEAESSEAKGSDESHTYIPVSPFLALDTRMFSPDRAVMGTTKSSTQGPLSSNMAPARDVAVFERSVKTKNAPRPGYSHLTETQKKLGGLYTNKNVYQEISRNMANGFTKTTPSWEGTMADLRLKQPPSFDGSEDFNLWSQQFDVRATAQELGGRAQQRAFPTFLT